MDRYLAKIATLLVEPAGSPRSVCKVFAAKPTPEKELLAGKLFGFAEVAPNGVAASGLIDQLLDQVKDSLYGAVGNQPAAFPTPSATEFDEHFGFVLRNANGIIARYLEGEGVRIALEDSAFLLGNIRQQQFALAAVGNVFGYLFHYRPNHDYRAVSVTEPNADAVPNPLRVFSQTVSGAIGPLDYLFFCTESILDYLSLHTVQSAVTGGAGTDAVRQLKQALAKANPKTMGAAVIINLVLQRPPTRAAENAERFDYPVVAARDSMRVLNQTQHRTSRLLTPKLLPDRKKMAGWLHTTSRRLLDGTKRFLPGPKGRRATPAAVVTPGKKPAPAEKPELRLPNNPMLQSVTRAAAESSNKVIHHPVVRMLGGTVRRSALWIGEHTQRLSLIQRITVIGGIVVTALLMFNLTTLSSRNTQLSRERAFASILGQVEQLRDASQSALIYQDQVGARTHLNEALHLLNQLPAAFRDHPTVARTRRELLARLSELRHEIIINEPLQLANFTNLEASTRIAPALIKISDRLYAQDAKSKLFFSLNLSSRAIANVAPSSATVGALTASAVSSNGAILLDDDNRVTRLDAAERIHPVPLNTPGGKITSLDVFHDRLYLLSSDGSSIFRADPTAGGYGSPRPWLSDPTVDLRQAVDIAVDGDVYALRSDGEIIRLNQGQAAEFSTRAIDPPLAGPTKIETSEASKYLYVLDPPTKRLLVVEKTGDLVAQYRSELFDELRDVIVDEAGQKIYLLNGPRIFGVPMQHLK